MLHSKIIKREDIDNIFDTFANEYIALGGKQPINLYLIGGAAILLNFEYRLSTLDIDAFFESDKLVNQTIENVSKKLNLPNDWVTYSHHL